jgi:quinol monooxygenase YgiN
MNLCLAVPLVLAFLPAQNRGASLADQVRAAVKGDDKPFTLVIRLEIKEGAGPKLEAAFAPAAKASRQEKGCLAYNLDHDPQKPTHYMIYERWKDLGALEAHLKADYVKNLLAEMGGLLNGAPNMQIMAPAGE